MSLPLNKKEIHVVFADEHVQKAFNKLKEGKHKQKQLYQFINRAFDDLKKDPRCGIHIAKRLIPKDYIKKYNITNLWKYDLPNAWRLIYSIADDEIEIISIIIEWFDHNEYENPFKY